MLSERHQYLASGDVSVLFVFGKGRGRRGQDLKDELLRLGSRYQKRWKLLRASFTRNGQLEQQVASTSFGERKSPILARWPTTFTLQDENGGRIPERSWAAKRCMAFPILTVAVVQGIPERQQVQTPLQQ